jgi:hypothetical protein
MEHENARPRLRPGTGEPFRDGANLPPGGGLLVPGPAESVKRVCTGSVCCADRLDRGIPSQHSSRLAGTNLVCFHPSGRLQIGKAMMIVIGAYLALLTSCFAIALRSAMGPRRRGRRWLSE